MSAPLVSKLCRESARCAVKRMQAHVTRQHFVGISRFPASGSHCVSDIDYFLLLMLKTKGVSKMQRLFSARSAEFADRQEKTIFDRGRVVLFTSVEMLSRVLIFLFGLVVLSLGIATVTHAGLGTGTVSSAAVVLSRQTGLSMGLFVFLTNVFFFVLQCLVDPKNLLIKAVKQLPVCAFFGAVFDVAMWLTSFMDPTNYGWAFMQVFLGTCLTGLGVSAMVFARLLVLPPEGFVIAVMHRFGGSFAYSEEFVDKYIGLKNIELYKQTDIYQEFKESIMSHEKQNEAVFDIIHYQIIDRSKFEDITKQMHLLSYMDRLAVVIMMASTKIPQVYIEGCFHYTSDVKATHSDTVIGASYYEDFFANKGNNNFNVPFKDGSYISRIKINGEFSYIESNVTFDNMEIGVLNHIAKTFEEAYIMQEKQLKSWLEEQKNNRGHK